MNTQSTSTTGIPPSPTNLIPQDEHVREKIKNISAEYVRDNKILAPLSENELTFHASKVLKRAGEGDCYLNFAGVVVNNELWRDQLMSIPYERRLLLLPQCLRMPEKCRAQSDEYGLVCGQCGSCLIGEFQAEAENLGYAVLVAEGSPVVMSLIASGQVEAVIGVGCIEVLEGVFPYIEAGAVPAIAVPLLTDGCRQTSLDAGWAWEAIYERSDKGSKRINFPHLRPRVISWFDEDNLSRDICTDGSQTGSLALEWLTKAGKRWRPLLVTCAYRALNNNGDHIPEAVRKTAVAIECFHKASLVHDDIEDDDPVRYGENTLHTEHGLPIALNVGDFLLGEGYRILCAIDERDKIKTKLLATAARGHTALCQGQGKELSWYRQPGPLTVEEVIDTARLKTSPGFHTALECGVILGRGHDDIHPVLTAYTDALGVAYQIKDDLSEIKSPLSEPSILLAFAYTRADQTQKKHLDQVCSDRPSAPELLDKIEELMNNLEIRTAAIELMEKYKGLAVDALQDIADPQLKSLLRLLIFKIFDEKETMECCDEHRE